MRIIEAYQVPGGNVSPDIFALPCVTSAFKYTCYETCYNIYSFGNIVRAFPGQWLCRDTENQWRVLSDEAYQQQKGGKA